MRRTIFLGSLLLALAPTVMAAQIYKWVDAQGVTHFGAQPPEGTNASAVNTSTAPPKSNFPLPPPKPVVPPSADDKQKAVDDKVKQEVAQQDAQRAQNCSQARENLAQLRNNPRVRVKEENGEYRRITEEERQARIGENEKAIQTNCN